MNLVLVKPKKDALFAKLQHMQELAISDKLKVGCIVIGMRFGCDNSEVLYFGGSNIETSRSFTTHAEIIALQDCLMHRCYPMEIHVTSKSKDENVFLCGSCRQQFLEVNSSCKIVVYNPDGSVKGEKRLYELLPNHKDVTEKNNRFMTLCTVSCESVHI